MDKGNLIGASKKQGGCVVGVVLMVRQSLGVADRLFDERVDLTSRQLRTVGRELHLDRAAGRFRQFAPSADDASADDAYQVVLQVLQPDAVVISAAVLAAQVGVRVPRHGRHLALFIRDGYLRMRWYLQRNWGVTQDAVFDTQIQGRLSRSSSCD